MTDLEALMRAWLESGDDLQRLHARNRIAMGFGGDPSPPPPATPYAPLTRSAAARVNLCLYRECRTGCQRSRCWAGRGDEAGDVSVLDCRDCLAGRREPQGN